LVCLYQDVSPTEGMIRFNVMDQLVSVWMKREKKFQGREFIGIKLSSARENCHSQEVRILDSFSYIAQLTCKRTLESRQLWKMSNFLRSNLQ